MQTPTLKGWVSTQDNFPLDRNGYESSHCNHVHQFCSGDPVVKEILQSVPIWKKMTLSGTGL